MFNPIFICEQIYASQWQGWRDVGSVGWMECMEHLPKLILFIYSQSQENLVYALHFLHLLKLHHWPNMNLPFPWIVKDFFLFLGFKSETRKALLPCNYANIKLLSYLIACFREEKFNWVLLGLRCTEYNAQNIWQICGVEWNVLKLAHLTNKNNLMQDTTSLNQLCMLVRQN